jgi:hypothetical protein
VTRVTDGFAVLAALAVACLIGLRPERAARAFAEELPTAPAPKAVPQVDPALAGSTIAALLSANGGRVPATGKELWEALTRVGAFAQLPVVFSAVRLDNGIGNPRVIITPATKGLSEVGATEPNVNGRLYLAANMDRGEKGADARVTSVEFISWNALHRRFDFGVIEEMGGAEPKLRIVDGGRCFVCHKNRGPILGMDPWTNTTHHRKLAALVVDRHKIVDVIPAGAAGVGLRDRVDGMALVAPEARIVDVAVRQGALVRLNRDTFRMMNTSDGGRKAFVVLLGAIVQPGPLDMNDKRWKTPVDAWSIDRSYVRFANDWLAFAKSTNYGVLHDFAPFPKGMYEWSDGTIKPTPPPPPGGFRSSKEELDYLVKVTAIKHTNKSTEAAIREKQMHFLAYDQARAAGKHGVPSVAQPSNPKAFIAQPVKVSQNPSGVVNPLMLASAIGLTEGDRRFMTKALDAATERLANQKVTGTILAKAVFEGPEFADVLAGGPLPDRDDFKDRFVAGLNAVLTTKYKLADGFAPDRSRYARDPRRDPKAVEEAEAAVVPTSACLRCHDVRDGAKGRAVEPIPALVFDPFDEKGRALWLQNVNAQRKQQVLARLRERVHTDADMPPQDSPEHELFRVKQAAAFDNLKRCLDAELGKLEKP